MVDSTSAYDHVIRTNDLRKTYKMGEETVRALDGVTLDIRRGEYFSIMGPSGSGKSTLFNMIGGLDEPTSGDVYIDGRRLRDLKKDELAYLRCRSIGYIFQTFNLIPVMNAIENVELPAIFRGLSNKDARKVGEYALERVGLADRMNHIPRELSGGQQQRVAIARAIVNTPRIILADEPTGNLDLQTGKDIIDLLNSLCRETGVTIVSATHDLKMIDVSNRVAWVRDGRIERIQERADIDLSLGVLEFEKQYSGE